jgi:formylmethanofuran dehydrogenase subunit E
LERHSYLQLHDQTGPARADRIRLGYINPPEGTMSADLQFMEEWIPERMDPGTVFVLENQARMGQTQNPFVAVMSCPRCGTMGLITRRQLYNGEIMICGGDVCSAEYRLEGENICFRSAQ